MDIQLETNVIRLTSISSFTWNIKNFKESASFVIRSKEVEIPQADPKRSIYWHIKLMPTYHHHNYYKLNATYCLTGDPIDENEKFECLLTSKCHKENKTFKIIFNKFLF